MATYWSDMCDKRTAVYRCYDADGELLYVGMTKNPAGRFSHHNSRKSWWPDVAEIDLEWFDGRQAALDAEASAIHHEMPLYNVVRRRMECC